MRAVLLWGPVLAFMVLVWVLASPGHLPPTPSHWDKVIHAVGYGTFTVFCLRAFHGGFRSPRVAPSIAAMTLAIGWGALDEWHQIGIPGRVASLADWIADAAGAVAGLALVYWWTARRADSSPARGEPTRDKRG